MTGQIHLESYVAASQIVSNEISKKCTEWHNQIIAFKVFNDEEEFYPSTVSPKVDTSQVQSLSRNKERWDSLPEVDRRDFIARIVAETNFKI